MRKKLIFMLITVMSIGFAQAQTLQVRGSVLDEESSEPIAGVAVLQKGTQNATMTDNSGQFTISVPQGATLVITSLGYLTQEVAAANNMTVQLLPDAEQLDAVLAIAYGTSTKGTYTGSASVSNSTGTLKDIPVTNFESALQGSVSGIQVGVPNGQPGAQQEIRIRGIGSFSTSSTPLYVIDGIPVNSGDYALVGYGGSFSIMNTLNPSDIESITVLKDAAAASMYGSRGANGVIMVTTKKGSQGKLRINLMGSYGVNDFAVNNRPIVTGDQNRELVYEGAYNQAIYNGMSESDAIAFATSETDFIAPLQDRYSDWIGALTRTAINQKYQINMQAGNAQTQFFASFGYNNDLGMYYDSYLDGYTGKINLNHSSNNWTVAAGSNFSILKQGVTPGIDDGYVAYANPYYASRTYLSPNIPIYNADGTYYEGDLFTGNYYNLVSDSKKNSDVNHTNKFTNFLTVGYEFLKGLKLKETVSYDFSDILGVSNSPSTSRDGESFNGIATKYNYKAKVFYSSLILSYNTVFANYHNFDALLGWDFERHHDEWFWGTGTGFASPLLSELSSAAEPYEIGGSQTRETLLSYFGRVNYSYADRYYLSASLRRDGSSRFGKDTRWGNFWSVSGSWRAKEENFLRNVQWINDLKVRASYGTSGTQPISLYEALATYYYSISYNGSPASAPSRIANPDLGWEKNNVLNIGLDTRLFDRLTVEFDYYNRQTNDMLLNIPISLTTGFGGTLLNYGGMNNAGLELSLGVDIFKGDFKWNSTLNLTHNRNKVTKIYNGESFVSGNFLIKEGESIYSFRAREWAGVDPATGQSMWYTYLDNEGNPVTTQISAEIDESTKTLTKDPNMATRRILAKADPDLVGGFRNTLSYKGFDLDFLLTFSLGGHSWDNGWTTATDGLDMYPTAIAATQLDRWQNPGDIAPFPKRMYGSSSFGNYTSSRWLHSTNHLRLKSLTFGYSIPKDVLNDLKIENVRLYVAGTNLLTWAVYKDYDPETPISGEVGWAIPALRGVTFGVEIGF